MNKDFNPKDFKLLFNLTDDSYPNCVLENTFAVFTSINNIFFLIYGNIDKSIISYNLINKEKINEIKNAHQDYITNIRHHLDTINKRDLFLSISADDYNVKVWNINNFQCLLNLNNIDDLYSKTYGYKLKSACFLTDKNQNYIIASDCSSLYINSQSGPIKIFDLNGNLIKEIEDSIVHNTLFIDTYFDQKGSNNYIITANGGFVEAYDYTNDKIYHKYTHSSDSNNNPFSSDQIYCYESIIISTLDDANNDKAVLKLIASCSDGFIKIWNFHSGEIFKIIKVYGICLHSICLINNNYLAVGCGDKSIKIVDIEKGKVIKALIEDAQDISCIKCINHPKFGICLILKGNTKFEYNDNIKLWGNKKYCFKS